MASKSNYILNAVRLNRSFNFYTRFMGKVAIIFHLVTNIHEFLNAFNNVLRVTKFTVELEEDNFLVFIDGGQSLRAGM